MLNYIHVPATKKKSLTKVFMYGLASDGLQGNWVLSRDIYIMDVPSILLIRHHREYVNKCTCIIILPHSRTDHSLYCHTPVRTPVASVAFCTSHRSPLLVPDMSSELLS